MAEEKATPKHGPIRKSPTVREKAKRAAEAGQQPRRLQVTRHRVTAPFRWIGKVIARLGKYRVFRIIGYVLYPPFLRSSWRELRQVTWPRFSESLRLTSAVFIFAAVFGLTIAFVDYALDKLFKQVLLR